MKNIQYLLVFFITIASFSQRTISKNTRFIDLDTISSPMALTLDDQDRLSMVTLPSGGDGGGYDNFYQYGQRSNFPTIGDEKVIYYAKNSNKFYVYAPPNGYREVPFINITNILKTQGPNDELITNASVGKRFVITQAAFFDLYNLKVKGSSALLDLTNSNYTDYDIITSEIQQGTEGEDYLLLRKSAFKYLDQPGKRIHISLFGGTLPPVLSTSVKGVLKFTTNHQNLQGLSNDFYCFINEGSTFTREQRSKFFGFQNLIDIDLTTAFNFLK